MQKEIYYDKIYFMDDRNYLAALYYRMHYCSRMDRKADNY